MKYIIPCVLLTAFGPMIGSLIYQETRGWYQGYWWDMRGYSMAVIGFVNWLFFAVKSIAYVTTKIEGLRT